MRRARRIDVWEESGELGIDAMFRDSCWDPGGEEVVVHEYQILGAADRATGVLLVGRRPSPRVLPYAECPGAAPNASWMAGTDLRAMRTEVLERLRATDCCTHLNDGLRSLAEVPVLAAARLDASLGNRRGRADLEVGRQPARSVSDHSAGSPSSTWTTPSISSTRRCDTVSPTAARRMKPAMSSHGPRPLHVRRDVPGGVRPLPQDRDDLGEAVPVVLAQLLEPGVQVVEAVLVRRQHLADLVGLELVERRR